MLVANPGAVVLTVFGGMPARPVVRSWDAACGFRDSTDAVTARRAEDLNALSVCGASQVCLDFRDAQYDGLRTLRRGLARAIARDLAAEVARVSPDMLLFPLGGPWHGDHALAARACRRLLPGLAGLMSYVYLDLPYGLTYRWSPPSDAREIRLDSADVEPSKRDAVSCYSSQVERLREAFGINFDRAMEPARERYWLVSNERAQIAG